MSSRVRVFIYGTHVRVVTAVKRNIYSSAALLQLAAYARAASSEQQQQQQQQQQQAGPAACSVVWVSGVALASTLCSAVQRAINCNARTAMTAVHPRQRAAAKPIDVANAIDRLLLRDIV